jgi:hypothetical protein
LSEEVLTVTAATVRVTLTTCEVAPVAAMVTVPLYVPAASPDVFIKETLTDPEAEPPPGNTESHEPPEVVAAVAVKVTLDASPTLMGCEAGSVPLPSGTVKLRGDGPAVNTGATTFSVTGMVAPLPVAPVEFTVTEPVYCAAVVRPAVLIEMLTFDGTVPLIVAASHEPPELVAGLVVKLIPGVPVTFTSWAAGAAVPMV